MTAVPLFSLDDCSFGYGETPVLERIGMHLAPGRFYGLLGPNGSGKTTLLDLLSGAAAPQLGRVLFMGRAVSGYAKSDLAKKLALVPQDLHIGFDFPVFEVVMMGRHPFIPRFSPPSPEDVGLVRQALAEMDIAALQERSVLHLSGGERQRVLVARALAQNTPVLLLDEPTASLDVRHTIDIMKILRQRVTAAGITVIATIHDLDLASAFCDELIVLHRRTVYRQGPVAAVMTGEMIDEVFTAEATVSHDERIGKPRVQYRYV
jgi:iron complex transport system ATP-binding protein